MNSIRASLWCVVLFAGMANAQTVVSREGTGEAAVVNKDEQRAVEEATQRAIRNAVEQAAGVKIDADTLVVNNQLVRDQVFASTSGYVKSSTVTSKKIERGVATVVVKADVITDNLDKDIEAARQLIKRMGRPSITIVIQEQTIPIGEKAVLNSNNLATAITQQLKADGWEVLDPNFANGKLKVQAGVVLGGSIDAKEIGDLSKVDYVLYGNATMRHQDFPQGFKVENAFPVSGEYDLTVFATDTGKDLGKVSGKLNPLANAAKQVISYDRSTFNLIDERKKEILEPLRKQVLEHARNRVMNGAELALVVTGLEGFSAASEFKTAIEALRGISNATDPKVEKGVTRFTVNYSGKPQEFALAVEQSTFRKRKLTVTTVTDNRVEVQVSK